MKAKTPIHMKAESVSKFMPSTWHAMYCGVFTSGAVRFSRVPSRITCKRCLSKVTKLVTQRLKQ